MLHVAVEQLVWLLMAFRQVRRPVNSTMVDNRRMMPTCIILDQAGNLQIRVVATNSRQNCEGKRHSRVLNVTQTPENPRCFNNRIILELLCP